MLAVPICDILRTKPPRPRPPQKHKKKKKWPSMEPKGLVSTISIFLLVCLLAFAIQVYLFSPITPDLVQLPSQSSNSPIPADNRLERVIKIGEGLLQQPEDVCADKQGILYTATRDGWIKRLHRNGTLENWKAIQSSAMLGLTISSAGDLIVCDAEEGLLKVNEDGVTQIVSHFNGSKIRFADDVIETADGSLYFSVASTKFGFHNCHLDWLEAKPHGQLLKYESATNEVKMVLDNLYFPNGVALSKDQDYLVVCETTKFRCLKHWLEGEHKGMTEVFVENLPGYPDNINLAEDGSFWIALLQGTRKGYEFLDSSKAAKHLVAAFPALMKLVTDLHRKATVVHVAADGTILRRFDDPDGKVMSHVTSAYEFEGHLYLGSLNTNFMGKLPLNSS